MSLSRYRVCAQVAVSDIGRAIDFYEGKLGLTPGSDQYDGSRSYDCGGGTVLYVYESPEHAGKPTATVARFDVDDLDAVVDELIEGGVTFEQYGPPTPTDARGVHATGYGFVAWFKDPDGNTFALEQV